MRKIGKITVVLFGACAVIWTVRAVLEIIYQTYQDSVFWFVMNLLCAVLWITVFLVHWIRYNKSQAD